MFHHWQPSIEQPMFRNVSGILKGAVPLIPKPLTPLRAAAHSRQNCWATSRALTTHRRSASVQCTSTPIFPTSDSALQQLIDAEGRILRSFSAEAALDSRDTAIVEEPSRALTAHKQESEIKKSTRKSTEGGATPAKRACRPEARIIDDSGHQIRQHDIPRGVWITLLKLRGAGHEGYLVGGAVRDMLLGARPKDFDILTTATPVQVKRLFGRCQIVGSRFPIALVHSGGLVLEVSSYGTKAKRGTIPADAAALLQVPAPKGTANAQSRDFTVNALMLDPFSLLVYDYTGGIKDCTKRVLRTIGSPWESFQLDPARILRAIRHAARCGLSIEKETGRAMQDHREDMMQLPDSRLRLEAEALFGYGSAAASMRLLWRYKLLDVLLPHLAERFAKAKLPRNGSAAAYGKEPILGLLEELDADVEPGRPVDWTVWAAVMAAPMVDEAMAEQLKAQLKATKARKEPPAAEEGGRRKRPRREHSTDSESTEQEEPKQRQECSTCQGAGARAHMELGSAIDASVKALTWQGKAGVAEAKSILPTAQWVRATHLLKAAIEHEDKETPSGFVCRQCKEKPPPKGIKRADLDILLDVLDAKPMKWRELRNQLAVAFQSAEQQS